MNRMFYFQKNLQAKTYSIQQALLMAIAHVESSLRSDGARVEKNSADTAQMFQTNRFCTQTFQHKKVLHFIQQFCKFVHQQLRLYSYIFSSIILTCNIIFELKGRRTNGKYLDNTIYDNKEVVADEHVDPINAKTASKTHVTLWRLTLLN